MPLQPPIQCKRRHLAAAAILSGLVLLSGCVEDCRVPPLSALDVPLDAPSQGGYGNATARIEVLREPKGEPVVGAAVVAFWDVLSQEERTEYDRRYLNETPEDERLAEEMEPKRAEALLLRTDADGIAHVRMPGARMLHVVAAADGLTQEWQYGEEIVREGLTKTITVALLERSLSTTMKSTWGPLVVGGASTAVTDEYEWKPSPIKWRANAAANRAYLGRMVSLDVALTWTNDAVAGFGDLAIGLGTRTDEPMIIIDESDNLGMGAQSEKATLGYSDLGDAELLFSDALYIGPATDGVVASASGLAYQIELSANFEFYDIAKQECGAAWTKTRFDLNPTGPPAVASNATTNETAKPASAPAESPSVGVAALVLCAVAALFTRRRLR